jgi:flagellar basal body-associated protein FliL
MKVVLRQTPRAVTPFGWFSVFFEFLRKIGYREQVSEHAGAFELSQRDPPGETFTAFLLAVAVGARRFAHIGLMRSDRALQALLGMKRFPIDDTIRNLFKRFQHGLVVQFREPL